MNAAWLVILAALIACVQSLVYRYLSLRALSYERRFSRAFAHEGERAELIEVLKNRKFLPLPWVRVESRISPNLRFTGGNEEREIAADQYHKSVFFLGAFKQVTRRHPLRLEKRGYYTLGTVSLSAGDLLGLNVTTVQLERNCAISVYPRLLSEEELNSLSSRWQGDVITRRFIMPDPFLTAGVRDYEAGDPVSYIHWKASAKLNRLMVKVQDYTVDPRVTIVLNVQASEDQWGELSDEEQRVIEHGFRIAATLCYRALSSGAEAGFASNGCLWGERGLQRPIHVSSAKGPNQMEAIFEAMARLQIHREFTFPTFLDGLTSLSGEDLLILSAYDSDELRARAQALRARGNSVTIYLLPRHETTLETEHT